jgi:MarR family transcriptional regulator, 2-MHQ and catechol-resistance regulon repressor
VTYLVDRLEKKGLVERRDCPGDRRARYAALTDAGTRLIADIFPQHASCIESLLSVLSPAEQETLYGLVKRVGLAAAERRTETASRRT